MNEPTAADDDAEPTANRSQTAAADCSDCGPMMGRRRFLAGTAAAGVALAAGTGLAAADAPDDQRVNYDYERAHDPYIGATATVDLHAQDMMELDHIADDGEVESLTSEGYVLADAPDDETPHNPVTYRAADLVATDSDGDGYDVERLDEFAAFPRGLTYDDDSDDSTDEVAVSALDSTHWTTDASGSSGTFAVTDNSDGSLTVSHTGATSGDTATATLDLSSVGSEDGTIESGVERKFLQLVRDLDTLTSGGVIEYAIQDSTGAEVVASDDPDGDASTTSVLATATGASQVDEARVGELGSLADIEALVIRCKDADVEATFHGINLERESQWQFGTREYTNDDDEVDTETVTEPSGDISVTSLSTLSGTQFSDAGIQSLEYDVEQRASELEDADVWTRTQDATERGYDEDVIVEHLVHFESLTAYDLGLALDSLMDEVQFPGSRYLSVEVASGVPEFEDWEDVEDYSGWSSRGSDYDQSIGSDVEAYSSPTTSETAAIRLRILQHSDEADQYLGSSGGAAVASSGGGGNPFDKALGALIAVVTGVTAWIGRNKFWG